MTRHNFPMILKEFRDYVCKYATQWHVDGMGHHHPIWSKVADALDAVGLNGMGYGVEDVEPKRHVITVTVDTGEAIAELMATYNRLLMVKLRKLAIKHSHRVHLELSAFGIEARDRVTCACLVCIPWDEVDGLDLDSVIDATIQAHEANQPLDARSKGIRANSTVHLCMICQADDRSTWKGRPVIWANEDLCVNCAAKCPNVVSGPCTFPKCDCSWTDEGQPLRTTPIPLATPVEDEKCPIHDIGECMCDDPNAFGHDTRSAAERAAEQCQHPERPCTFPACDCVGTRKPVDITFERGKPSDRSTDLSTRCPRPEKCNFPDCDCFGTGPA